MPSSKLCMAGRPRFGAPLFFFSRIRANRARMTEPCSRSSPRSAGITPSMRSRSMSPAQVPVMTASAKGSMAAPKRCATHRATVGSPAR